MFDGSEQKRVTRSQTKKKTPPRQPTKNREDRPRISDKQGVPDWIYKKLVRLVIQTNGDLSLPESPGYRKEYYDSTCGDSKKARQCVKHLRRKYKEDPAGFCRSKANLVVGIKLNSFDPNSAADEPTSYPSHPNDDNSQGSRRLQCAQGR